MTCQRGAYALEEMAFLNSPIFGVLTWTIFGVRPWVSGGGGGPGPPKKRGVLLLASARMPGAGGSRRGADPSLDRFDPARQARRGSPGKGGG